MRGEGGRRGVSNQGRENKQKIKHAGVGKQSHPTCLCIACAQLDVTFITVSVVSPIIGELGKGLKIGIEEEAEEGNDSEGKYARGLPGEEMQPLLTTDWPSLLI